MALPPRQHRSQQGISFQLSLFLFLFCHHVLKYVILDLFVLRTSLSLLRNGHIAVVESEIRHLEEAVAKEKKTAQSKGNKYSSTSKADVEI